MVWTYCTFTTDCVWEILSNSKYKMTKTFTLFKRMSLYLAEKAINLIDATLLSTEEIGWDSQQQLIVNGRIYHDTDIVILTAYVMFSAGSISVKLIGFKVCISALGKIGLELNYVIKQNVKRFLRKNNQLNDDDTESTDYNSAYEKEYKTSDHGDSNVADDNDEDGEAMDGYDDTNDDDDRCYEIEDGNGSTDDDGDDGNDGSVTTGGEEDENYYSAPERYCLVDNLLITRQTERCKS